MLASAVLVLATVAAGQPLPTRSWVEPKESFEHISAFRVRADVHDQTAAGTLKADIEEQVKAALRSKGVALTDSAPQPSPHADAVADVIIDVEVLAAEHGTAVAWSFHVSQMVLLATGSWAFAATWVVGDLIDSPPATLQQHLRDSLQPVLDEFCAAYAAGRAKHPQPAPRAPDAQGAQL